MANDPSPMASVFSIDVSASESTNTHNSQPTSPPSVSGPPKSSEVGTALIGLTRQLIEMQTRQNVLLEQLLQINKQVLQTSNQANAQRQTELNQWRNAHPKLVKSCRNALESLSEVQLDFLQTLADEVEDGRDTLGESEYAFNDFLDRYGPRMAHLNGILQVLGQLGG